MTDELNTLNGHELSVRFATELAGWKHRTATQANPVEAGGMRLPNSFGPDIEAWWHETNIEFTGVYVGPPSFSTRTDFVLPHATPGFYLRRITRNGVLAWEASVPEADIIVEDSRAAHAACIALLRSARRKKGPQ